MKERTLELNITTHHQFQEVRHYLMSKYLVKTVLFTGKIGVFSILY